MLSKPGWMVGWSLFGAAVMYVWGFLNGLAVPDIEEVCNRHNQPWVFEPDHRESMFPLSTPCNSSYDLVPFYVNPVVFALLASAVVFTVIAVVKRVRREKKT
jgi:hypothetical protein